ncbi:ABC transporter [bacterium]|nr:ABC transporter [bacterium]
MNTLVKATNLKKSFDTGSVVTHVLRGIDLEIKQGEFVAIMGKSGAGKSTLMYQLSALDIPTSGEIIVDGIDVAKLNEKERTAFRLSTLGYVFQDYALVPDLNARENVMMPLLMRCLTWDDAEQKAEKSLDDVGLVNKYTNLPSELSGGEQQRVAVARAIAIEPKIIFADEPTANLDSVSGQQVVDLLTNLHKNKGQTIVMVTHEMEYTESCDSIIEMEDGLISGEMDK